MPSLLMLPDTGAADPFKSQQVSQSNSSLSAYSMAALNRPKIGQSIKWNVSLDSNIGSSGCPMTPTRVGFARPDEWV